MKWQTCVQCSHSYEYYQRWHIIPDYPRCGALGGYLPIGSNATQWREHLKKLGVD
jgi:hypothetical protein